MSDSKDKRDKLSSQDGINQAIRLACQTTFGVLDSEFLCKSLSILQTSQPICIGESETLDVVMKHLQANRVGCVLIVDKKGTLSGIFSERDYILKAYGIHDVEHTSISTLMTTEPVTVSPDTTLAYALNLMSQGGFRHLPIVDDNNQPVGIVSVKDVVDYIVSTSLEDLLSFEVGE